MNSKFLRLYKSDFVKGLIVAVLAVVFGSLQQGLLKHGLDVMAYDWGGILTLAWKAAGLYLTKNFLTDENETIHLGFAKFVKK